MSLSLNIGQFNSLFPDAESDKDGEAIKYTVEDSDYRIYNPTWQSGQPVLVVKMDHIRGGATDDHVELHITFDTSNASMVSIEGTWEAGNDGYQIPKVVIEVVDASAEILGAVGALETAGISEAAAQSAVAVFDGFCKLFNTLSELIVRMSDNGGRFYFTAVVCHTVNRLNSCVSVK
ncbi:hypothetical protein [Rudanella lutea]|uniref:hypothetical protein n=1 Tax=Rudanella lutea TaxID=451374 RepID=UPI0003651985|nr:hypothetical protein [Rudanella lutea]